LDTATANELNLVSGIDPAKTCVVIISHDCDIANDRLDLEPRVEAIIGRTLDKSEGSNLHGKSSRTLHLEFTKCGQQIFIELNAACKIEIDKRRLAIFQPDVDFSISSDNLSTLRTWLSARYRRAAFPDAFNERFASTGLKDKFEKLGKKYGDLISAIGFKIDGGDNVERATGDAYKLITLFVYKSVGDIEKDMDRADQMVEELEAFVASKSIENEGIVLVGTIAQSEEQVTIATYRTFSLLDFDYLSMRNQAHPTPV
jgi:hypothetical protein